jgi:hypothetical protein
MEPDDFVQIDMRGRTSDELRERIREACSDLRARGMTEVRATEHAAYSVVVVEGWRVRPSPTPEPWLPLRVA